MKKKLLKLLKDIVGWTLWTLRVVTDIALALIAFFVVPILWGYDQYGSLARSIRTYIVLSGFLLPVVALLLLLERRWKKGRNGDV